MINFIYGEIVSKEDNLLVLKSNNIGYEVVVSSLSADTLNVGDNVQLYCYLQVKEDGLALFGFTCAEEKALFKQLISVSGIGPKLAITVLSGMQPSQLAYAIVNSDTDSLRAIKGLGKKTAERIIVELREKLEIEKATFSLQSAVGGNTDEVITILKSLGISRNEATRRIKCAIDNGMKTTEQILNFAIKNY
ncbi:MAG: Holliday junction branch migration protein RuvA [Clostridia bacterium]|nr:Holliday junction branch migration protein RuvA [Clostridia bacterium]